jgi:hypothetical protein
MNENAKFMESIEGRTQRMQSSFQQLANSLIDSSLLKGTITMGTGILNFFNLFDGAMGKLVAYPSIILAVVGAIKGLSNSNFGQGIKTFVGDIGKSNFLGLEKSCRTYHRSSVFVVAC